MLKDPLTDWDGVFPYDALAFVGITPYSTMKQVMDASFELMAQNLMTPEVRGAWDQLRITHKRLLVDFFLYQFDPQTELDRAQQALDRRLAELSQPPDVSHLLTIDPVDVLSQMVQDLREIPMQPVKLGFIADFEYKPELPGTELIQFDL